MQSRWHQNHDEIIKLDLHLDQRFLNFSDRGAHGSLVDMVRAAHPHTLTPPLIPHDLSQVFGSPVLVFRFSFSFSFSFSSHI